MNPIRVAMLIQNYLPHVGGAERQLHALAPLLRERGVDVHVITRQRVAEHPTYEEIDGVPVHRIPARGLKFAASLQYTIGSLPLLMRLRPDVLHAHELLSPTTTAMSAKRILRVPVVAKILRGGALGDLDKLQRKAFGKQRMAGMLQNVEAFITISREIDAELEQAGIPQSRRPFIANGVDIERFTPVEAAQRRNIRERLGLPLDAPLVIFTGRLAPEKRVNHLVDIWPTIRHDLPDATLLLLGTGPEEALLREKAGDGVIFTGRVEDVIPYLQAANSFVLPSVTEGLSNALLEAMAVGLAPVVTDVGGASDVVQHGVSGYLVKPDDPHDLQAHLRMIVADKATQNRMGEQAQAIIKRHYSLTTTANRLRTLYDCVMQGKALVPDHLPHISQLELQKEIAS